jgi:hypothetical protein
MRYDTARMCGIHLPARVHRNFSDKYGKTDFAYRDDSNTRAKPQDAVDSASQNVGREAEKCRSWQTAAYFANVSFAERQASSTVMWNRTGAHP